MPGSYDPGTDLVADLALLTEAVDDPSLNLGAALDRLRAELTTGFASLVGFAFILGDETTYLISTLPTGTPVRSSLLIPLGGARPRPSLLLYASAAGAFDAELAELSGSVPGGLVRDAHLSPARPAVHRTVRAASLINQAIGVLIGLGATPEQALSALHDTAAASNRSEVGVAIDILNRLLG